MKGTRRWISPWADSEEKPSIDRCVSRVVDRRFVFGDEERGEFRIFMRMMENFSGCRGWPWSGKIQLPTLNFQGRVVLRRG